MTAPPELYAYKSVLLASRGSHGRGAPEKQLNANRVREFLEGGGTGGAGTRGHLVYMDELGTDVQLISPRPFQMMHSESPPKIVQWFIEACNNVIHTETEIWPERFIGIAGLPQVADEPVDLAVSELERAVGELGFKGALLNPDPYENSGTEPPVLGDRFWYPLYEKFCELDVPAYIHSCSSHSPRQPYSMNFAAEETTAIMGLLNSQVFDDFPTLKVVVSHGGGAIPYQVGRFDAASVRRGGERFTEKMRKLYYDTCLYTQDAIELLVKTVGVDRCLFGSECPGAGTTIDPEDGHQFDDVAAYINNIDWLSDADRTAILSGNAVKLFRLEVKPRLKQE